MPRSTSGTPRSRRGGAAALTAVLALAGASCTSSSTPRGAAHAPCATPPPGIGPGAAGTLQLTDNGRTVCLATGKELTVFLKAPSLEGPPWGPIEVSDAAVLAPGDIGGIMTLVRGVTGAVFSARGPGTARLSATRSTCGPTSGGGPSTTPACLQSWSAVVIVTARSG